MSLHMAPGSGENLAGILVEHRAEEASLAEKAFCIHGHFYQPPREDPFTGEVPKESGASPYHDWNERIHAECYRPNSELGNFEKISFNIGPTLFSWMDNHDPVTSRAIVEQDRANMRRYGVGNAIAQAYNHTILPLASRRDKVTQVYWGIADFQRRFGRKPQGMWLPETAADTETLQVLAEQGITFTILAPWQAAPAEGQEAEFDPSRPYRVDLPEGRQITVFFYDQDLSARVSFDSGATTNADTFARSILQPAFSRRVSAGSEPHLVLVASDGELYGHHQNFRDRFLAHLLDGASSSLELHATYPALWLKEHPARQLVGIRENTSWSCHHGVLRWSGSCGCTPGEAAWKKQLRAAFNQLADQLDDLYYQTTQSFFPDPWALRNRYIHVLMGELPFHALISELSTRTLSGEQSWRVRLLLESQRERQRIFTSCGWFFEDFDRIEPRNSVAYAAQAIRLARLATGEDLSAGVMRNLRQVRSSRTGLRADQVFARQLQRAATHDHQH